MSDPDSEPGTDTGKPKLKKKAKEQTDSTDVADTVDGENGKTNEANVDNEKQGRAGEVVEKVQEKEQEVTPPEPQAEPSPEVAPLDAQPEPSPEVEVAPTETQPELPEPSPEVAPPEVQPEPSPEVAPPEVQPEPSPEVAPPEVAPPEVQPEPSPEVVHDARPESSPTPEDPTSPAENVSHEPQDPDQSIEKEEPKKSVETPVEQQHGAAESQSISSGSQKGQIEGDGGMKRDSGASNSGEAESPKQSLAAQDKNNSSTPAATTEQIRKVSSESQNGKTSVTNQSRKESDSQNRKVSSGPEKEQVIVSDNPKVSSVLPHQETVASENRKSSSGTEPSNRKASSEPQKASITPAGQERKVSEPKERKVSNDGAAPDTNETRKSAAEQKSRESNEHDQRLSKIKQQDQDVRNSTFPEESRRVSDQDHPIADTTARISAGAAESGLSRSSQPVPQEGNQQTNRASHLNPTDSEMHGVAHQVDDLIKDAERIASGPVEPLSGADGGEIHSTHEEVKQSVAHADGGRKSKESKRGESVLKDGHATRESQQPRPHSVTQRPVSTSAASSPVCTTLLDYAAFLDLLVEGPCSNLCDAPNTRNNSDPASIAAESGTFKSSTAADPRSSQDGRKSGGSVARKKSSCGHLPFFEWKIVKTALGYGEISGQSSSRNITTSIAEVNEDEPEPEISPVANAEGRASARSLNQPQAEAVNDKPSASSVSSYFPGIPVQLTNASDNEAAAHLERARTERAIDYKRSQHPMAAVSPGSTPAAANMQGSGTAEQKPCTGGRDCLKLDPINLPPIDLPPIDLPPIVLTPLGQTDVHHEQRTKKK